MFLPVRYGAQTGQGNPPRVRALLGAIIDELSPKFKPISNKLQKSLNPASRCRFKLISEKQLPNLKQFNVNKQA